MGIQQFELFHGAVLTKLTRSEKPITLRLIEKAEQHAWAQYRVNDVVLYVKYSTVPHGENDGALRWDFTFGPAEIELIGELIEYGRQVAVTLVCGAKTLDTKDMEIGCLNGEELQQCLDLTNPAAQGVHVRAEAGKSLRIWGPKNDRSSAIVAYRNTLENWQIPE